MSFGPCKLGFSVFCSIDELNYVFACTKTDLANKPMSDFFLILNLWNISKDAKKKFLVGKKKG